MKSFLTSRTNRPEVPLARGNGILVAKICSSIQASVCFSANKTLFHLKFAFQSAISECREFLEESRSPKNRGRFDPF